MGIDTKLTLPPGTRVRDVGDILAHVVGLPSYMHDIGQGSTAFWVDRKYLRFSVDELTVSMVMILLTGPMVDGQTQHETSFHYEWDRGYQPGCVGMMARSTPFWVAAFERLAETFGGTLDYADCDAVEVDVVRPPRVRPASDGEPWQEYQNGLASTERLTKADLRRAAEHAAYRPEPVR